MHIRVAACILLTLAGCARFRVQELKPTRVFAVPLLSAFPHLAKGSDEFTRPIQIAGITSSPAILGNRIFIPDPTAGIVRIFKRNADTADSVVADKLEKGSEATLIRVRAGIPGRAVSDDDENVFIVLHEGPAPDEKNEPEPPPERRTTDRFNANAFMDTPARIVHIKEDQLAGIFGREGGKEGPAFERILRLHAMEGALYVFHSVGGARQLSVYQNEKRIKQFENFTIPENDALKYFTDIEDMFPAGQSVIVSVVLRNKNTFAPEARRVYSWDGHTANLIYTIDEDADQFIAARPDGGFTVANSEDGNRMLLKIYSPSGEYLNNRLIVMPDFRNTWREVTVDAAGRVFSNRIYKGSFEVYEWK